MSIFVDQSQLIEISVRIQSHGSKLTILPKDEEIEDSQLIICHATGRDFDTMSTILENATVINHINGERLLRIKVLFKYIILLFFKSWNLLNEDQQRIPINEDNVNKMNYKLVKELAKQWLRATS